MARRKRGTPEQQARRALIGELLSTANVQSIDDIQELFMETIAEFMEGSLEAELDEELGYEPYDVKNKTTDNSRNGHSKKSLRRSMGKVEIDTEMVILSLSLSGKIRRVFRRTWKIKSFPCTQRECQHPISKIISVIFTV